MNKKKVMVWMLTFVAPLLVFAQQTTLYPNDYLTPEFHAGRRAAFKEKLSANGVGIFFASQVRVRNNDVDYQYAQSKNFYYFTGLEEPNAVLLLFKQPVTILDKTGTEFIFVQNRDPQRELWTGKILGVEGVQEKYKIANVFINDKFRRIKTFRYGDFFTVFKPQCFFIVGNIRLLGPVVASREGHGDRLLKASVYRQQ